MSADESDDIGPRYWVSYRSVVHRRDARCGGPLAERYPWSPARPMDWDKACRNCLPGGLPVAATPLAQTPSDDEAA